MIGVPMPNPRDAVIADLYRQMDDFFGAGNSVQVIPTGMSADAPFFGTNSHQVKLRAERDKLAPAVHAEAAKGVLASVAAKNLGMHIKRVLLIAQENGFKFSESL